MEDRSALDRVQKMMNSKHRSVFCSDGFKSPVGHHIERCKPCKSMWGCANVSEDESHSILVHVPIKQQLFLPPAAIFILQLEDKLPASLLTIVDEGIFWPEARRSSKNIKLAVWENLPHLHPHPPLPPPPPWTFTLRVNTQYTQNTYSMCSLSVVHCGQSSFSKGLEYDVTFMSSQWCNTTQVHWVRTSSNYLF